MTDHVFKNTPSGLEFVGDFDGLYAEQPDPWEQAGITGDKADYYALSRGALVSAVKDYGVGRACEIGCGHGHLTALLDQVCPHGAMGVDVSNVAVARARKLYPNVDFIARNICDAKADLAPIECDAVIWANCLWYLLHALDHAFANSLGLLDRNDLFIVSQGFLHEEQRYGREVIDGFNGAVSTLLHRYGDRLQLIEAQYDDHDDFVLKDGLLIFRVK